jgi:hypothetical protein
MCKVLLRFLSLDTIGIAGFSHDFRTLHGEHTDVETAFESFSDLDISFLGMTIQLMASVFPILDRIPTFRKSLFRKLSASMEVIAINLIADSEKNRDQKPEDKSILGLLRSF